MDTTERQVFAAVSFAFGVLFWSMGSRLLVSVYRNSNSDVVLGLLSILLFFILIAFGAFYLQVALRHAIQAMRERLEEDDGEDCLIEEYPEQNDDVGKKVLVRFGIPESDPTVGVIVRADQEDDFKIIHLMDGHYVLDDEVIWSFEDQALPGS